MMTETVRGAAAMGPHVLSAWNARVPQAGDRRTLTRAWFVTPKDEYGLRRRCSPIAQHIGQHDNDERERDKPDWYCETMPVVQIEQVTEEWDAGSRDGAWLPAGASGVITLCERHARIFLGDAKYDALPWPGGQVAFVPAAAPITPTTTPSEAA